MTADATRAWGWVRHLRSGGTTPWSAWSEPAAPDGLALPGAQQLELLRRLNGSGTPATGLADRVLATSAAGRGRPDLDLVGAAAETPFGPRPVDPGALPAEELLRVAVTLLADDLHRLGPPSPPRPPVARPWRRRYRLAGDPALVVPLRDQLVARGRPPGGVAPRVLVLGGPLDRMLADVFVTRCFETGMPSWPEWLATIAARDRVPPRVDLVRVAARWARLDGADRVVVVTDPGAVPGLVGVRRGLVRPRVPGAAEAELARRVAGVLGLLTTPERREQILLGRLRPWVAEHARDDEPTAYGLPAEHHAWVAGCARRMRHGLRRAGYPVVGDLADLDPVDGPGGPVEAAEGGEAGPEDTATLRLAVRLLLAGSTEEGMR